MLKLFVIIGYFIPSLILFLAFMAMLLPWQIAGFSPIKPDLPLIVLFFWTYIRSDAVPPLAVFICALLPDIFLPVPLGYHCLLYFIIYGVMLWRSMRPTRPTFAVFYTEFIVISLVFYVLSSVFNQFVGNSFVFGINVAFSWFMTLAAFGVIFPLLNLAYALYPSPKLNSRHSVRDMVLGETG